MDLRLLKNGLRLQFLNGLDLYLHGRKVLRVRRAILIVVLTRLMSFLRIFLHRHIRDVIRTRLVRLLFRPRRNEIVVRFSNRGMRLTTK